MEFRDYIEAGIVKCGTAVALARFLEQDATVVRNAKAHRRGLPLAACYKLADLLGERRDVVTAASALVTEKDSKVIEYLRPFVRRGRMAHPMIAPFVTILTVLMLTAEKFDFTSRTFLL